VPSPHTLKLPQGDSALHALSGQRDGGTTDYAIPMTRYVTSALAIVVRSHIERWKDYSRGVHGLNVKSQGIDPGNAESHVCMG
jgi:hypothetical protein